MEPIPNHWYDVLIKLGAAATGTLVSFRFIQGKTQVEKFITGLGGIAFAWFATDLVAALLKIPDEKGLVGFLLGMFGMALLTKAYQTLEAINATGTAETLSSWFKKLLGVEKS